MKTYHVRVVLEPDEGGFFVYCPELERYGAELERYGAATWGHTREEAISYIKEVLPMVLEDMLEFSIPIPEEMQEVSLLGGESLAVTI